MNEKSVTPENLHCSNINITFQEVTYLSVSVLLCCIISNIDINKGPTQNTTIMPRRIIHRSRRSSARAEAAAAARSRTRISSLLSTCSDHRRCFDHHHPNHHRSRTTTTMMTVVAIVVITVSVLQRQLYSTLSLSSFQRQLFVLNNIDYDTTATVVDATFNPPSNTLWILTCETRENNPEYDDLMTTAKVLIQDNGNSSSHNTDVRIHNVCLNKPWGQTEQKKNNFLLKCQYTFEFLLAEKQHRQQVRQAQEDSSGSGQQQEQQRHRDYVLYTDADSLFNPYAVSPMDVVERFHRIVNDEKNSNGNNSNSRMRLIGSSDDVHYNYEDLDNVIVTSAEPNCWIGHFCTDGEVQTFYGHLERSDCPQFVNAGQYMGTLNGVINNLHGLLYDIRPDQVPGADPNDDQARMTWWYANRPGQVVLDKHASLFRSLVFGLVDKSGHQQRDKWKCGIGTPCGLRNVNNFPPIHFNTTDKIWTMSTTPTDCTFELNPFAVHGNGPGRAPLEQLAQQIRDVHDFN
jgi:hypothetical protein